MKKRNYWDKERCLEEARKYNNRSDFQKKEKGAYISSLKNGWLDEVCSHMIKISKNKGYWNQERCLEESKKYNNRKKFQVGSPGAYTSSLKNGWLDFFYNKRDIHIKGYWNKERCLEESRKYNNRKDFILYSRRHIHIWWKISY